MTTRRQHYVWRKYLEPWADKKGKSRQLWCLRRDREVPFRVDVKNVAVERDFYRVTDLVDGDVEYVRALAFAEGANSVLQKLNENWIEKFVSYLSIIKFAKGHPRADQALIEKLDEQLIQFQESAYEKMETGAVGLLRALQGGDVSFLNDDSQATHFFYFLAHQYFRTKAVRARIREGFKSSQDIDRFDRTWPILRYVYATNVAYSTFVNRKSTQVQVLSAAPGAEFITGDQPVVNSYGAFAQRGALVEELEFYYPVSSSRAVMISNHAAYRNSHGREVDPFRMTYLNQVIEFSAHEQVFAHSEKDLIAIQREFCKHT